MNDDVLASRFRRLEAAAIVCMLLCCSGRGLGYRNDEARSWRARCRSRRSTYTRSVIRSDASGEDAMIVVEGRALLVKWKAGKQS
jgi:hypothetical protein